ncbi:phosphoribosylaminoimidazole-succinocarboxamide synthase [Neorhodopirellula lusitana]|uniref:Phosphoribosylaminoimidazole-succinocarboxamide synthase n=1 Tax=Neorhodopirellula lusitana TaxID=445327 RepID=A0ABY1QJ87_9BACT|nr:phosphoribosylaminoimidazolesuccinocarboxamide synthase [Neorhodopirellula lusitana]SMP73067.1 phosphoribosylaminoimidazole-succinocarboxamide synthase [Neorhodopirellula lusitana]
MNSQDKSSQTSSASDAYRFDSEGALLETQLPLPRRQGKVRDVYDLGDDLLIVSTDRISAFDYILPSGIPGKGALLTAMSRFWFDRMDDGTIGGGKIGHHLISTDVPEAVAKLVDPEPLRGRVMVARKAEVVPFECVVRGYLEGSGWRAYQDSGEICGVKLPAGLRQCDQLASPIFTPSTKAEAGHDENVSFEVMAEGAGIETSSSLRELSLMIYQDAARIAAERGILIADTKFEFGWFGEDDAAKKLIIIDEVLTPDSSRFWSADEYEPGRSQRSFDKQFVREWLLASDWDRNSEPPKLPAEIIEKTAARYREGFDRLVG